MKDISKIIGFHRKHQRVPTIQQVEAAYLQAKNGQMDGAVLLADWKRHCFYVRSDYEREVMTMIFTYCSELIN
ncbi:hypothetical protein [Paenibacillus phytorum]|uniref:hypothetical protein n=1 Tax=Paenibacillus phytorum TaxID=2654977 RepID=UPI00149318B0|nr:hypothetical protein [Paenibacillus phytorum]